MTKDQIIQMAREFGDEFKDHHGRASFDFDSIGLERFVAAIRAATKEEDARICEKERVEESTLGEISDAQFNLALEFAAAAIRTSK